MANKKTKNKKKASRLKKTSAKKNKPVKKALRNKPAKKKAPKKKNTVIKTGAAAKKKPGTAKKVVAPKPLPVGGRNLDSETLTPPVQRARPESQSGDLQGLSDNEGADSESVGELLEEGNAFEAGVVSGVERAGNDNQKEVRTHEVAEDDVPGEYLDKD
jgi:hypothetical protein